MTYLKLGSFRSACEEIACRELNHCEDPRESVAIPSIDPTTIVLTYPLKSKEPHEFALKDSFIKLSDMLLAFCSPSLTALEI